jgi:hypothetical protein
LQRKLNFLLAAWERTCCYKRCPWGAAVYFHSFLILAPGGGEWWA